MKKIIFLFVFSLYATIGGVRAQDWIKIGANIDGEARSDWSGTSVSLSSDGSVLAIGSPGKNINGAAPKTGQVRVYQDHNGVWSQIGADINGSSTLERFGYSVSLSSDGSIIAVGAPQYQGYDNNYHAGRVRIYQNINGSWTQIGFDISDSNNGDSLFGYSVSLNSDGSIVAIGSPGYEAIYNNEYTGKISIYQNVNNTWTQIGNDISYDNRPNEFFGSSVSLSSDGSIVVASAIRYGLYSGDNIGQVRIYQNNSGTWTKIADINGVVNCDQSGYSVSLSSDGSIVAIGEPLTDTNGNASGQVRVFQNNNGTWAQVGQNIEGESAHDWFGYSVSLSSDGSIIAIGAYGNNDNGFASGQVSVYQYINGVWTLAGTKIDGEAVGDKSGFSVSISSDGSIVAIGAPGNDGNFADSGHVRVYKNDALDISELKKSGISIFPNPSNGTFTIENAKDYEIIITDITGKIVYQANKTENIVNKRVCLRQSGIYIINFTSKTKNFSSKIIVK